MSETLVLAKDSTGQLWVTWNQSDDVWVNRTTTDDVTWGSPFVLPVQGNSTSSDDITAVMAFNGDALAFYRRQGCVDASHRLSVNTPE